MRLRQVLFLCLCLLLTTPSHARQVPGESKPWIGWCLQRLSVLAQRLPKKLDRLIDPYWTQHIDDELGRRVLALEEQGHHPSEAVRLAKKSLLLGLGYGELVSERLLAERPDLVDRIVYARMRNQARVYYRGLSILFDDFQRLYPSSKVWVTPDISTADEFSKSGNPVRVILRFRAPPMFVTSWGPLDGQQNTSLMSAMLVSYPYIKTSVTRDQALFLDAVLYPEFSQQWQSPPIEW